MSISYKVAGISLYSVLIIGIIGYTIWQVSTEAKEFNRCTGGSATFITALTTELRIENCKNE